MGTAWAQGGPPAAGAPSIGDLAIPVIGVLAIFYVLVYRPEQRRKKELDEQLTSLKRNDQVVMTGGLHGRVVGIGDKVVTVEIAPKVSVQFDRESIQRVLTAPGAEGREKEREKS